jgi:ABC-2 type transport system permease protein
MITDIQTVLWKEFKEIIAIRGSRRGGLLSMGILIALIGIFMPLQSGPEWFTNPLLLIAWSWMPLFLVMGIISDSIAGERERHTLETLLASRIPDAAILLGKILAAVLYAWVTLVIGLLLGALVINIAYPQLPTKFYDIQMFLGVLAMVFLGALLMTAIGVLASLRAETVRQAYQRMSIGFLAIWLIPIIGMQIMPTGWKDVLNTILIGVNWDSLVIGVMIGLAVLDCILLMIAFNRFKRIRLILD